MKKLKVQKALFGKLFKGSGSTSSSGSFRGFGGLLPDLFKKVLQGDTTSASTWSKDKMANLGKYAPNSYGTGEKSTGQKMTTLSKGGMLRQGKPKIAMKGWK